MAFIDTTYFDRNLSIGDISEGDSPVVGNTVNLQFIPYYEKEYLLKALGYKMYTDFMAGLEEVTPAQKWLDLRDGVEYVVNDRTYKWDGFKNDDKRSPIANYVYVKYWHETATASTTIGVAVNNVQNATIVSPANKMHMAWVEMEQMNRSLWHYLDNHRYYPDYTYTWCERFGSVNGFDL